MSRVFPDMPVWIRVLMRVLGARVPEEALGDVCEEYAGGRRGALWLCRQLLSLTGHRSRSTREKGTTEMMSNIWSDIRYAFRTLRRNPGFAVAAIAPLALGIGINTGIFSILDTVALQPVSVPHGGELVNVYQQFRSVTRRKVHGSRSMLSLPEYQTYRDGARTLSGVMAYSRYWTVTLGSESAREIDGVLVTCNYFDVLELPMTLGGGFTRANCEAPDAPPGAVISHDLWTGAFAADPTIVGKTLLLNGRNITVLGVGPPGFGGIDLAQVSFFVPIPVQPVLGPEENYYRDPRVSWLTMVGRKQPGRSLREVRADLDLIARQIDQQDPGRSTTLSVNVARVLSPPEAWRDILNLAAVVFGAFALVLLIACANVTNLLLARAAGRTREIAVRLAVGARRSRLIQQLLTESLIVALIGAAAGSILAWWSFRAALPLLLSMLPGRVPSLAIDAHPSLSVLSFALVLTIATGLIAGLAPALHASRLDLQTMLRRDTNEPGRHSGRWLRGGLIGVQVAVCMVLLISAGLLLRGLYAVETADPGFDYRNVTVVSFDLRGPGYDDRKAATVQRLLTERIGALPGVESIAQAARTPLSPGRSQVSIRLPTDEIWHQFEVNSVTPGYFSLLAIPIVRGRTFSPEELTEDPGVAIVTEATARRYWPGQDPIGRRMLIETGPDSARSLEVVGVARDAQVSQIAELDSSYVYLPASRTRQQYALLVRGSEDFAVQASSVRAVAREIAPALVLGVTPLEENLALLRNLSRIVATLSGSLSLLALLLASVGVYGVVSCIVSRQLREVSIRMMLGASSRDVQQMILRQMLGPVAIGLLLGIGGAAAASGVLRGLLFGISPVDPIAFVGAGLCLLGVAAVASLVPTRKALALDPMTTLRRQ